MRNLLAYITKKPLTILLLAFLLAIVAEWQHWGMIWVFIFSALGVIPLAGYIGEATEVLAVYTGPKIGHLDALVWRDQDIMRFDIAVD